MQNLLEELKELLTTEPKYLVDGELLKNKIIEDALKLELSLIKLLLKNSNIKSHFFIDVDGIKIFDKVKFQDFVSSKAFLPDSFTAFKNKIGLSSDNKFLKNSNDVVLNWAYKDCILEGGMTKEETKNNVSEIFYNETLAPDEITRLLDEKVLTNFSYWDAQAVKENKAKKPKEITLDDNLLIKGNNLLALHCLKRNYAGKVKLIYIDPPYNTGNDSFKYNDNFNHSSWLTFMKNRLEVAKDLLRDDGAIFISIDNKEICYLQILLDEVFGEKNRQNIVTIKRSSISGAKVINRGLVNVSEYLIFYSKSSNAWNPNKILVKKEIDKRYGSYIDNISDNYANWRYITVLDAFSKSKNIQKKDLKRELGDIYESELQKFYFENSRNIIQFALLDDKSVSKDARHLKNKSKGDNTQTYRLERDGKSDYYIFNGKVILFYHDRLAEIDGEMAQGELASDIWLDVLPNDIHNEGGITLRKGKKPEKLIQRIIEMSTTKDDLILDFFSGSGTTPSVAHKMGRKWIAIEQMNYIKDLPEARIKNVIAGDQTGISKSVNWQSGGSFVYCELLEWNERFIEKIRNAKESKELLVIYEDMKKQAFFRYDFEAKKFDNKGFSELKFEDQQKALIEILDKNHLYVNYSEIEDEEYKINDEDKKLTKSFYKDK